MLEERRANELSLIDEAKRHYEIARDEVAYKTHVRDAMFESYVRTVANNNCYIIFPYIKNFKKGDKKTMKDLKWAVEHFVTGGLEGVKIEDRQISFGWKGYAVGFRFKYKKTVFELYVPDLSKLDTENFFINNCGKMHLVYEQKEGIFDTICSSYEINDIKKSFLEFVEKIKEVREQ